VSTFLLRRQNIQTNFFKIEIFLFILVSSDEALGGRKRSTVSGLTAGEMVPGFAWVFIQYIGVHLSLLLKATMYVAKALLR
jgi:hypothetical protein